MKCRAKVVPYNYDDCLKIVCIKVDPVDYEQFYSQLTERIDQFIA